MKRILTILTVTGISVLTVAGCARPESAAKAQPPAPTPRAEAKTKAAHAGPISAEGAAELQSVFSEANEYVLDGQLKEAASVYERAIDSGPKSFKLHYNLGNVYMQSGSVDEAITQYRKALAMNPEDADVYVNLGVAYFKEGRLEEAIDSYKRALALDKNDAVAHYNLGVAYEKAGRQSEADSEFATYHQLTSNQ